MSESPRDPRLEIPEVLRTPVKKPQLPKAAGPSLAGLGELGIALAIGIDFLATAVAGGALGWAVDYFARSSPVGLVVGLLLGFLVGTVRLIRRLNKQ